MQKRGQTKRGQPSSQASHTPPGEAMFGAGFRLLFKDLRAATAPRMRRATSRTFRPSRDEVALRRLNRPPLVQAPRSWWAGHSRCPQPGQGASPVVRDGSIHERARQIGHRRGSPPPQVRDETTEDIDRSSRDEFTVKVVGSSPSIIDYCVSSGKGNFVSDDLAVAIAWWFMNETSPEPRGSGLVSFFSAAGLRPEGRWRRNHGRRRWRPSRTP
jgi:hypothetical protein